MVEFGRIHPDLGALNEGDIAYTMDYRSVYDLVLAEWFGFLKIGSKDSQTQY